MDLWKAIEGRYSVRDFVPTEVSESTVQRILEAAIRAPSAGNRQPWHFIVVRYAEMKRELAAAAGGQDFVGSAPVVIVVCADAERSATRYGDRGRELYCLQDTAAATELLMSKPPLVRWRCLAIFDRWPWCPSGNRQCHKESAASGVRCRK